ncbi:MAG: transcriptional regulator, TetR family [Glaciihabitans sp.]|nr:transcriptional regulator, TetR family [Glaciihabitans sp.]
MPNGKKIATNRRQVQAADTRRLIVESASRLFLARGFVGTTIEAIAADSEVAVQTVYNSVGNKAALLSATLDMAASDPSGAEALEFMRDQTNNAPDLPSLVEVLANWFTDVNRRTADVFTVISQAAAVDADVAKLATERDLQRLRRYLAAAAGARERGGLVSGMTDAEAAAAIWSTAHPQVHRMLVTELSWTDEQYRNWVRGSLTAVLR